MTIASAQGKDFSSYQPPVTAADLKGLSFAVARVSDWAGNTPGTDPHFEANWVAFKAAKIHRGAYWYLSLDVPPKTQADYFVKAVRKAGLEPGDMLIADSEIPAAGADAMTHAFCTEVEVLAPHCPVLVYTNHDTGQHLKSCTGWPLWFAWPSPTAPPPELIAPWEEWRLWQYGEIGSVDADAANGTAGVLDEWIGAYLPTPVNAPVTVTADGKLSIAGIADAHKTQPAAILRATAVADGKYPAAVAKWIDAVFTGTALPLAPVPAGTVFHLPA